MALAPTAAQGCVLKIGNAASPEVFTAIEGINEGPDGPGFVPNIIEARHHSSTASVKKATHVNVSEVTFTILYDSTNAQHLALETAAKAKTRKNFQEIYTDTGAAQYAYAAYVGFVPGAPVEGFNTAKVTLSIDGDVTIT